MNLQPGKDPFQVAMEVGAKIHLEILKWVLQGENKRLERVITTDDTLSLAIPNHPVVKRPQCPDCGYLKPQKRPLPVIIGSRKKKLTSDGGHRCFTPEETLAKYRHHIDPITGVEAKGMEMLVLDQTSLDIGLNVVKVIVPGWRHFWKRLGAGRLDDVPV